MQTDSQSLNRFVSIETGLAFNVKRSVDAQGDPCYLLRPAGVSADHAFAIRAIARWRRVVIAFEPGKFAADLLNAMGNADATGRTAFRTILGECTKRGGEIEFRINDSPHDPQREETWPAQWSRLSLTLTSRIEPVVRDADPGVDDALEWSRLLIAAVVALLPVKSTDDDEPPTLIGYAEGGATIRQSTRYERDHRNRAAAIAMWGCRCQACGLDFGDRYGDAADGYIEVHHITPVSTLEPGTVIDPARDLVPLCSNCHAVAHRRDPPFSIDEIRQMLVSHTSSTESRR